MLPYGKQVEQQSYLRDFSTRISLFNKLKTGSGVSRTFFMTLVASSTAAMSVHP
jgi:hypothetical protein